MVDMERRRSIHEQIKLTKLNKLTVKQGDQNVTLNLKVDLLDPSVPIADKVLGMLEAYVSKQQQPQQAPMPPPPVQPAPVEPEKPEEPVEEPPPPVEASVATVDDQYLCRLCRLKFQTDRALYDHVSRIHGGKSSVPGVRGRDDYETASNDESEDNLQAANEEDESNLSSSSDQFLRHGKPGFKSLHHKPQKRLNVAIRVAKVAYLNSKLDAKTATATDLHFPNGFRGNFFSQERLPLRSCKIKMKLNDLPDINELNESELTFKEQLESHLVNRTELSHVQAIDRNTCEVVFANRPDRVRVIPNDKEIRDFFKSLIVYIPLTETIRLGDFVKRYEAEPCLNSSAKVRVLNAVHELVLDAKQFGLTLYELKKRLIAKADLKAAVSLGLVKSQLALLAQNCLVLPVGVVERVYVAYEFKEHWVIKSYKNLKGRGARSCSVDSEDEEEEPMEESASPNEKRGLRRPQTAPKAAEASEPGDQISGQYKQVCLVPRPWRYIDGLLNRPVLKKMLESVVLYLKSCPNSTFENLSAHFSPALQPVMTLELVEMLESLNCVEKIVLSAENDCDMFSDFTNGSSRRDTDSSELDGNETNCYTCTQESIFILKKLFPNE